MYSRADGSDELETPAVIGIEDSYFFGFEKKWEVKKIWPVHCANLFYSRTELNEAISKLQQRKRKFLVCDFYEHLAVYIVQTLKSTVVEQKQDTIDLLLSVACVYGKSPNIEDLSKLFLVIVTVGADESTEMLTGLLKGQLPGESLSLPDFA